jgi:predicted TIM-barrel fold metal-dependent hydrolase
VRLNLASRGSTADLGAAPRIAARIAPLGWHLQFYLDVRKLPDIDRELVRLPVDIVIDHFGHASAADGIDAPGFQALLRLTRHERCWFKLIGPYRISSRPPRFPDTVPMAQALLDAAPERCVWGTDWPHPNTAYMPNDGDLADLLADWIPDERLRSRVLCDNPARLYDFPLSSQGDRTAHP